MIHLGRRAQLNAMALGLIGLIACSTDAEPKRSNSDTRNAPDTPTWHRDIAPLTAAKCAGCHQPGGVAPFSLSSYVSARPYASLMADAVEQGRMPPFLARESDACQPRLRWRDDIRVSQDEVALLRAWATAGAPEGDADEATPIKLATPRSLEREDVALKLPSPITVDGANDINTCVLVDPELTTDVYVTGGEITPGNRRVVHHVLSYAVAGTMPDGSTMPKDLLAAEFQKQIGASVGERYDCFGGIRIQGPTSTLVNSWAPGMSATRSFPGAGIRLSKESLIVINIHYHPSHSGEETDADTRLSLMLADSRPALLSLPLFVGNFDGREEYPWGIGNLIPQDGESANEFAIPAGAQEHVEEMTFELANLPPSGISVFQAGGHMHWVGRSIRTSIERPTARPDAPRRECLIDIPSYDFNWQRGYIYDSDEIEDLPNLQNGDVIHTRCVYDNSLGNPRLSALSPDHRDGLVNDVVRLGEDTTDEMCVGTLGVVLPNPYP